MTLVENRAVRSLRGRLIDQPHVKGSVAAQATESNFLQFLNAPKQFDVPIYQRPYTFGIG
jgi:hypothetical protein